MQDGIYHVRFSASTGASGEGLVVIRQGSVNGGDAGFLYTGQLTIEGEALSARLNVKRWNRGQVSVIGDIDDYELQLTGKAMLGNSFTISGGSSKKPGVTITITGDFLSVAA